MTYPTEKIGDKLAMRLNGEIDLEVAPKLRDALINALALGHSLLIEMSAVSYIDSSGIASLVEALQNARQKNLDLALIAPSQRVRRVLELARLDKVFVIHDDLGSAA